MAATTLSNLGMQYKWFSGEDGWNTGMDANLLKLDTLVQGSVKNYVLTSPPGSPSEGDRYIVGVGSTGAWSGQDAKLAIYINAGWSFYTAKEGWKVWDENSNREIGFNGTAWVLDLDGDRAYADSTISNVKLGKGNPNVIIDGYKFRAGSLISVQDLPYEDIGANFAYDNLSTAEVDAMTGSTTIADGFKMTLNSALISSVSGLCRRGFLSGSTDISSPRWRTGDKHQFLFRCGFMNQMPDGSNNFVYRVGVSYPNSTSRLIDSDPFSTPVPSNASDGFAAFFYIDNSSGFIKFTSGYAVTTETTTTSVSHAINTMYSFKIVVETTGVVKGYINGTLVATHNTGVCVDGAGFTEQIGIRNIAATTATKKGVLVDEIAYKYELATARTGFAFD